MSVRKYRLRGKKYKFKLLGAGSGKLSEIYSRFPQYLASFDLTIIPFSLIYQEQNEYLAYGYTPKNLRVQVKLIEKDAGKIEIWVWYWGQVRWGLEQTLMAILNGRFFPKVYKMRNELLPFIKIAEFDGSPEIITSLFPTVFQIYFPGEFSYRLQESVAGDYLLYSDKPQARNSPVPYFIFKLEKSNYPAGKADLYFFCRPTRCMQIDQELQVIALQFCFQVQEELAKMTKSVS